MRILFSDVMTGLPRVEEALSVFTDQQSRICFYTEKHQANPFISTSQVFATERMMADLCKNGYIELRNISFYNEDEQRNGRI